ncbi:MAG: polyprenyl synthetase family protein [Chloroflexota bacterium]|nr:MAG: polyprenyl synthetase family protein [Chloroflexota bacterium]
MGQAQQTTQQETGSSRPSLAQIFEPVLPDMPRVEEALASVADVQYPLLAKVLSHVVKSGGKRLRPGLTLLSGRFYDYDLSLLVPMAVAVELLHAATLVHDDVIDDSGMRRGSPTLNSFWNGGTTILIGDYVFAKSADFVASTNNTRVIRLFADTLMLICDGELRQRFSAYQWQQSLDDYYKRIEGKTARLFRGATESGAILSNAPEEVVQALSAYGHQVGMAFQIIDDILDFVGDEHEVGKPIGNDLAQGTLTLPTILLMARYPNDNPIPEIFANGGQGVERAIERIVNSEVIAESYKVAASFCERAREAVAILPPGQWRQGLLDFTEYLLVRSA